MNKCPFCGAAKKHIIAKPKTKHYELGEGDDAEVISTSLFVMQCMKCDTRWIKYKQIKEAVIKHERKREQQNG